MERKEPLNILVLGAGISGLCAAWNLVQDGHRVIVLEKKSYCGGLGSTFQRGGYRYDLGPHNIHSQKEIRDAREKMTPLGRLGLPDDIAYGILYLACDESSWVTGIELVIDGGEIAW